MSDPTLGNEAILAVNEHGMTAEALTFGSTELKALVMPTDVSSENVGQMSLDRWTKLVEQMDAIDPSSAGMVKPEDCFTTQFLP